MVALRSHKEMSNAGFLSQNSELKIMATFYKSARAHVLDSIMALYNLSVLQRLNTAPRKDSGALLFHGESQISFRGFL